MNDYPRQVIDVEFKRNDCRVFIIALLLHTCMGSQVLAFQRYCSPAVGIFSKTSHPQRHSRCEIEDQHRQSPTYAVRKKVISSAQFCPTHSTSTFSSRSRE
ncbi:hypothetical protein BS47DRAFT_152335 [Hydnum rufescens UP504]|uniref:Uncharacterized protein n=1 Tax=Hydnum rufescens UP504 TaxID=1448309 RepID=A0A9P6DPU7_9AGAM|nr:hypothetical protein BS47DRAFT_152335 [Hydnum rufescens UP504]